jgi:hypothetical protein
MHASFGLLRASVMKLNLAVQEIALSPEDLRRIMDKPGGYNIDAERIQKILYVVDSFLVTYSIFVVDSSISGYDLLALRVIKALQPNTQRSG